MILATALCGLLTAAMSQAQPERSTSASLTAPPLTAVPLTAVPLTEGAPEEFDGLIDPVRVVPLLAEPRHRTVHRVASTARYVDETYTHRVSNPGPGFFVSLR